jgi:hypothetical protein
MCNFTSYFTEVDFEGRKIILRLKFPDNAPRLEGHFNQARVLDYKYTLESI